MRGRRWTIWLLAALVSLCACQGKRQQAKVGSAPAADSLLPNSNELPLPKVPASLTHPQERADYVLAHFWDAMDFGDTARSHDRAFVEQNVVNFLFLFPHAPQESVPVYIDTLMHRASKDLEAFTLVSEIVEQYLDEPNSPMRNEDYYILFLESTLRQRALPEEMRLRPQSRLRTAMKNRPGNKATDFQYTDSQGSRHTLYGTKAERLLLVFYDPACDHCSAILRTLTQSDIINSQVDAQELSVLAVYTEGDRRLWEETKAQMPARWTVGIDESRIVERELYSLPAMPVIYLLDAEKRVLLKDPAPDALQDYLAPAI